MSVVPESQEILVENFKKEDQEAASLIARSFNTFNIQMIQAINQSLTVDENMLGETRTFTFTSTSLETTFKYNGNGIPRHMKITGVDKEPLAAIFPYWSQDGKGNITVKIIGGYSTITQNGETPAEGDPYEVFITQTSALAPDTKYNITFIILGG
jgi:hypothetical protein